VKAFGETFRLVLDVLVDSNFLLLSISKRFDMFSEIESLVQRRVHFLTIPQVVAELKKLESKRGPRVSKEAALALQLANRCTVVPFDAVPGEDTDTSLLRAAKRYSAAVATADVKMRGMLRENHLPIISLRGRRLYCEPGDPELWFLGGSQKDI